MCPFVTRLANRPTGREFWRDLIGHVVAAGTPSADALGGPDGGPGGQTPTYRFAPSPKGHLHLGHALSACLNFDGARAARGRFLLRIEDIDPTRYSCIECRGIHASSRAKTGRGSTRSF